MAIDGSLEFVQASAFDDEALADAFNQGYAGYFTPVNLSAAQMRGSITNNDTLLEASWVAQVDGRFAGIGLLARRGDDGWIGGMGVAQAYRRQGIGRLLMNRLLDSARALGLRRVGLEVISQNEAAHRLYLGLGFVDLRRLLILEGGDVAPVESDLGFEETAAPAALRHFAAFHAVALPWQRALPSLEKLAAQSTGWLAKRSGETLAYALGIVGQQAISFLDAAFAPGEAAALRALLAHIHAAHAGVPGRIINLGEDEPAWPVFRDLGYCETLSQIEMAITL